MQITNPYKPGAGHMPPYLAGREYETNQFKNLLKQDVILSNLILTGLRGVGKTVLLDTFKPIAISEKWLWVGSNLSEAASANEQTIALRLLTDLAVVTSPLVIGRDIVRTAGFNPQELVKNQNLSYNTLIDIYNNVPGLVSDKLKGILEVSWEVVKSTDAKGVIFAYDEAQTLSDNSLKEQYSLSLILDVFQSIQKKNIPLMLVFVGLPTLFPKLINARTFSERMFTVLSLSKLSEKDSKDAILKPLEGSPIQFAGNSVDLIYKESGGYPYFIQFICREVFDIFIQRIDDAKQPYVPIEEITRKLDKDFFSGRWARATDRQRDLLFIIAELQNCDEEFTVQEIVEASEKQLSHPFTSSHVNQMLAALNNAGLVYKNRHGKYSFAVPLLGRFIRRQKKEKFAG